MGLSVLSEFKYLSKPAIANLLNVTQIMTCNLGAGGTFWETNHKTDIVNAKDEEA